MFISLTSPVRMGQRPLFGQQTFEAKYVNAANTILDAAGRDPVNPKCIEEVAIDRELDLNTLKTAVEVQLRRQVEAKKKQLNYRPKVYA